MCAPVFDSQRLSAAGLLLEECAESDDNRVQLDFHFR